MSHSPPALAQVDRAAVSRWARSAGCRLVVAFGSAAASEGAGAPRDLDLAVLFPELPDAPRRLQIIGELQDLLGVPQVDVVFLHRDTDPVLRFEVFKGGAVLHEEREGLFVDEAVRALALYEDALPFRRALREKLAEGVRDA